MNAFLDDSMVLPPGDFDRKTLLPIMHMAKKKLKERREKEKALKEQQGLFKIEITVPEILPGLF